MFRIWFLNVGQGDSQIVQYDGPDGTVTGIIDSNNVGTGEPRVLSKLKELEVSELSFVALTHPHADHYKGLYSVLEYYRGRIDTLYTYPIVDHLQSDAIKRLAAAYARVVGETISTTVKGNVIEFVKFLSEAKSNIGFEKWIPLDGEENTLSPQGFIGVELRSILPPKRAKGYYFQLLRSDSNDFVGGRQEENDLSLAFQIKYSGVEIILGGDGSHNNWIQHIAHTRRRGTVLQSAIVKMPHHGSKYDCKDNVIDHFVGQTNQPIAIVSANGRKHPDNETLDLISRKGIKPYCTNLARSCGAIARDLVTNPELDPVLNRFLNSAAETSESKNQPCQGDILVSIDGSGQIKVDTQFNHPCPYRGGYDSLFN